MIFFNKISLTSVKGIVIKSTGNLYLVRFSNGTIITAKIQGKFRIQGIKTTNPIAVGDVVEVKENLPNDFVITTIQDRKNYIIRKSINLSKQAHIIAANIEQAMLIVTLVEPITSTGFIDRFLVTAEAYHIPTIIVFNKVDVYTVEEFEQLEFLTEVYQKIGYTCLAVSVEKNQNIDVLFEGMKNKTTLLSGHSGVGKSSLLNLLEPSLRLKTSKISEAHKMGKHTTTYAEMHPLSFGGYVVDTPGIKAFGLVDFDKNELSHYFLEMRKILHQCKFNNCKHINEPNCAIKNAVEMNEIAAFRYKNYLAIFNDDEAENYRGKGY